MKTKHLLQKTFLLAVALLGGVSSAWAIDIPTTWGEYIPLSSDGGSNFASYVTTHDNCSLDSRLSSGSNYYTIGSSKDATTVTLAINVTVPEGKEGNYVFGFKTGSENGTSEVAITLLKSGDSDASTIATAEPVVQNGNWDPTLSHMFYLSDLEATTYTITITATKQSGNYCGNFGCFFLYQPSGFSSTMPTDGTTTVDLSGGSYYKSQYNDDGVISGLDNGGYMDYIMLNNNTAGYYKLVFNIKDYKAEGTLTAKIYNFVTGEIESTNTMTINSTGDKSLPLPKLTTGLKRVRFDFSGTPSSGTIFNYKNVSFLSWTPDNLPMYGTAVLDMSKGSMTSSSNPRYSSNSGTNNEISYIYNGVCADNFYVVIGGEETAYYDLRTVTSNYNKGGTFKVTITDIATNTIEVNAQESDAITSNNQNIIMPLIAALKPGLKKIRFDFVKDGESEWLYNIKDVSFYKRSLNEGYDYTPVAATSVDVVLTRSITANKWSTIVLPFAMTNEQLKSAFGEHVAIAELTSGSNTELTFSSVTETAANKPYAIKVASNFTSATINGVTIVNDTPTQSVTNWNFVGKYSSTTVPTGSYYFKSNKLYQKGASGTTTIKPFRAYLTYTGSTQSAPALNFVIDGETTGIAHISADGQMALEEGAFYNLNGQRVANPTKGLYIVNGKKVVIK